MAPIKNINRGFSASYVSKVQTTQSLAGVAATSTGTITTPGNGFVYHFFTQPGTFYVSNTGYVDYIIVGSGAAGGTSNTAAECGGGGAGGFNQSYGNLFPVGTYTIAVGVAPGRTTAGGVIGSNGNPSSISGPTITTLSAGGGVGGGVGASPGGASGTPSPNPGGTGVPFGMAGGGGGGGAGGFGNGTPGTTSTAGGVGGIGYAAFNADPGIPPAYGTPGPSPGRWFAGGGGGGGDASGSFPPAGGGGNGGTPTSQGVSGTVNTGGGGGGAGSAPFTGGAGGSGIVIIRYKINPN